MATSSKHPHPSSDNRKPETAHEEHQRKQRILTKGRASITRSIVDAIVIKDDDVFFLSERDGRVPLDGLHGLGLYYHDCRYLNGYDLTIAGTHMDVLSASSARGYMAVHQLTNPDIQIDDERLIQKEEVGLRWERVIDTHDLALHDVLTLQNFSLEPVAVPLTVSFRSAFEDVYAVRGLLTEKQGTHHPPEWTDSELRFLYDGADGLYRSLTVRCSPSPDETTDRTARFDIQVPPRETKTVLISLLIAESADVDHARRTGQPSFDTNALQRSLASSTQKWTDEHTEVESESTVLNRLVARSLVDLRTLRSSLRGQYYFAAGVPWFVTLFGRDSLIAALETLAFEPGIAADTLRLLASYQGQKIDHYKDEQPGKILHELRVGEMARLNEIPHTPYYGTVDATPLFLILLGRHAAWTGDLTLFNDLRANVELALTWIDQYGDGNNDGYVEYMSASNKGLVNQGWKDSGDGIINTDGSLAVPPIALVEVQGYVYLAKNLTADLYERVGDDDRARTLRREARDLRKQFDDDFWMDDADFFALALQHDHKPAAVISSNPGQALWTGIVEHGKARRTVARLLADDMFSGWGVRTLSRNERGYNPVGYHLGTVWPHDNALIAAGFRRYRFDDAFQQIFAGIVEASLHFHDFRLPELFSGFGRSEYSLPVHYPVACHPQAWAAGAVPYMIETALGFEPDAFNKRLQVIRPILPPFARWIEVRRMRVGQACVDLRAERSRTGTIDVDVLRVDGDLHVLVEDDRDPSPTHEARSDGE